MDPTSYGAKLDQAVKGVLILIFGVCVCLGFLIGKVDMQNFMPVVYMVVGAAFGRGMAMMPSVTKTTEITPDGGKKETMVTSSVPVAVAVPVPVSPPGTTTTVTTPATSTTTTTPGGTTQ